jgi:F-type H+-transporting ATPase subunit epsilon
MSALAIGELTAVTPEGPLPMAIHGGFLQVAHDEVIVLADAAERAEDIDEARAEAARQRAEQRLSGPRSGAEVVDLLRAQLSLQRALIRLRVRRRRAPTGAPSIR